MADSPKWTRAQQQAISCRGGTVLVSAAAGSGKTAVLVQRVIDILTDREHPVGCRPDFGGHLSNAAAEEMRQRINARLSELLAENRPTATCCGSAPCCRRRTSAPSIPSVWSWCVQTFSFWIYRRIFAWAARTRSTCSRRTSQSRPRKL